MAHKSICIECGREKIDQIPRQFCSRACFYQHRRVPAETKIEIAKLLFPKRVQVTPTCHIWTGSKSKTGFGSVMVAGKGMVAARFAWIIANGPIPDGMNVLHRCDNPVCVNPGHLFLGTQKDNVDDMWRKGRGSRRTGHAGSKHSLAKLDEAKVIEIRKRLATGERPYMIARAFGVTNSTVYRIKDDPTAWATATVDI